MAQKKYQQLREKNLKKAERIYNYLKQYKVMSENTFAAMYYGTGMSQKVYMDGSYANRVQTTKQFLEDHGLMTYQMINGIRVYAATQKCFRTKSFKSATKEVQEVTNSNIDKAIQYVTLNNNLVPAEFEAPVVANMLGLEGEYWKYFVDVYSYGSEHMASYLDIKYKVVGPVQVLAGEGKIVKI